MIVNDMSVILHAVHHQWTIPKVFRLHLFVVLGCESDLCILCGGYAYGKRGCNGYVCGCGPSVGPPGTHSGVLLALA